MIEHERRYCTLCQERKVDVKGYLLCPHCDKVEGCKGGRCGACESGRRRTYAGLDKGRVNPKDMPDSPAGSE